MNRHEENPFAEVVVDQITGQTAPRTDKPAKEPISIGPDGMVLTKFEQVYRVADMLYDSGLVPNGFKNKSQVMVALLRAIELHLPPLQALEGMTVIQNKVGIMGDLALAMVESSGELEQKSVKYEGAAETLVCTITITRKGREPQDYSFSVQEAMNAGIYNRSSVWKSYSKRMCYYRALGFALRDEFSDILKGIKTVEELQDYPENSETKNYQLKR